MRLLNRIWELSTLSLRLWQEGAHYKLVASGEPSALEALADQVSLLIPRSLFLRNYAIEEVMDEEIDTFEASVSLAQQPISFKVPYCPECQKRVIETLNPFVPCNVCGFSDVSLCLDTLVSDSAIAAETGEMLFTQLADRLIERGELHLPTYNGVRHFSLLHSDKNRDKGILVCNPVNISEKFLITQGELEALMMVEKPTVRLKPKLKFKVEYALNEPFYPVFLADDKVTLALATVLKDKGIDAVFCDALTSLRVAAFLEQFAIVAVGRDMLPWRYPFVLRAPAFCIYRGFEAFGDLDGLWLDTTLEGIGGSFISYVANGEDSSVSSPIRFEPAHASLRSVVLEHKLKDQALCEIYLSRQNTSQICSFSPRIGYTPMVLFADEMPSHPRQMLEAIAKMDEGGMRLVENFKQAFPAHHKKIVPIEFCDDINASMITRLWAMAALFIGISETTNMHKACETLESTAIEFGGKSGPRIDYKVIGTKEGYQLDPRLAIRSVISFKLAGVDEYLLSFGLIDSLADFIAEQAENADANIGITGVALGGSLFENRQLLMRTYNAISANYPLYKNERIGLDGAAIALGAITLGSE